MKLVHGGDTCGFFEEYGYMPIDFSANLNPLGLPNGVRNVLINSVDRFCAYPDPLCRELCVLIAKKEKVNEKWVLCANGAADIIFRLATAFRPKHALVLAPSFAEYELALKTCNCNISYHKLYEKNEFLIDRTILSSINSNLDMLFICNPNNPTGQLCDMNLLCEIVDKCEKNGVLLVVDECFNDFLVDPDMYTLKGLLDKRCLIILKAFTKIYAMAGIRLGYCLCSNTKILRKLSASAQPWSVSGVAQLCGVAAINETGYLEQTCSLISAERSYLKSELLALGFTIFGSHANYIFLKSMLNDLDIRLRKCGVLIRACENYRGLNSSFFRIAVRSHEENFQLIEKLKQILKGQ